jgi:hypothetical protein
MIWVGTTEVAALLRYFGCRAQLVEFLGDQAVLLSRLRHLNRTRTLYELGGHYRGGSAAALLWMQNTARGVSR